MAFATDSVKARVRSLEKLVGAAASQRRCYSLEQLVTLSLHPECDGDEAAAEQLVGPPAVVLKPGETCLCAAISGTAQCERF